MTKIPSVEDYSIDITSDLAGVLPSGLYDKLEERTIKGLTEHRLALLTELTQTIQAIDFYGWNEQTQSKIKEKVQAHLDPLNSYDYTMPKM